MESNEMSLTEAFPPNQMTPVDHIMGKVEQVSQPKVTVGFERSVSVRPYETAKASVFIQAETEIGQSPKEMEQALRDAFFQAKAQVFEQLGIEFEVNEHGAVMELLKKSFGPVDIVDPEQHPAVQKGEAQAPKPFGGTDLKCEVCPPGTRVWDNRDKKRSGEYKSNAPDGKCSACRKPIWLTPKGAR